MLKFVFTFQKDPRKNGAGRNMFNANDYPSNFVKCLTPLNDRYYVSDC